MNKRGLFVLSFLFLFCSSSSIIWNVQYAAGDRERDKLVAQLKAKKIKHILVKKSIQDIYEIRFKENDPHK
jgi:hypothetical protein